VHWLMMHFTLQGGTLELNGKTPLQLGVTCWRTLVTYVPQTRVHPPGTPAEFYFSVQVLTNRALAGRYGDRTSLHMCHLGNLHRAESQVIVHAAIQGAAGAAQGRPASSHPPPGPRAVGAQPAVDAALGLQPVEYMQSLSV
jgi:hypothetical protein